MLRILPREVSYGKDHHGIAHSTLLIPSQGNNKYRMVYQLENLTALFHFKKLCTSSVQVLMLLEIVVQFSNTARTGKTCLTCTSLYHVFSSLFVI